MPWPECESAKTKPFAEMVSKFRTGEGESALFVTTEADQNVVLSARNIPRVTVRTASDVNALDVVGAAKVIVARRRCHQA